MSTLYQLTDEYMQLLEFASSDAPEDIQAFFDTIDGLDFEIGLKADDYAAVIRELEGQVEVITKEAVRLQCKATAINTNVKRMKDALKNAMIAMGKKSMQTELNKFTVVKNGGKLPLILNEEFVTDDYKKTVMVTDKEKIRSALENGVVLDFAALDERGTHLTIK